MNEKELTQLIVSIINNADSVMYSWRAWSDEKYFVDEIKKDARRLYDLITWNWKHKQ